MKIKLVVDLPIQKKHGAFKDKIFTVVRATGTCARDSIYFFIGEAGEECGAYNREIKEFIGQ